VFVTRTFSKAYGMAGLRAGYAIGAPAVIKAVGAFKMPYGLGTLTLGGAIVALANQPHIDAERKRNTEAKAFTLKALADLGVTGADSQANFVFMKINRPAAGFRDACRAAGVLVGRDFPPFEKEYCRISIGTMDEMKRAVDVFKKVLGNSTSTAAKDGI
jgi:histidinol-phosphate aminotransferase